MDNLYLLAAGKNFELISCRFPYLSAGEIINEYGLDDSEYWETKLINGEFVENSISDINSVEKLHDGIISILVDEQWGLSKDEINWDEIIKLLLRKKSTFKIGSELRSMIFS